MIVRKEERERYENSPDCIAYEYPLGDKDINIALVEIDGRYPETGYAMNEEVKELIFVAEGKGKITIGDEENELKENDVVLIYPKDKYFFDGKFKLVIPCSPAWNPEQHKIIDG